MSAEKGCKFFGPSHVIAVSGASGKTGQHIVEGLLIAGFTVLPLLRRERPDLVKSWLHHTTDPTAIRPHIINYISPSASTELTDIFRNHQVDTVISVQWNRDEPEFVRTEEVLLQAALAAGAKRFAPSNWAMPLQGSEIKWYEKKKKIIQKLEGADISWTEFAPGVFMNYFGLGAPPKPNGDGPLGHLGPVPFVINSSAGTADIVGTGDIPVAFTAIQDVGRGVALACELKRPWKRQTGWLVGDAKSYNQVVKIFEDVTGRNFKVTYTSEDGARASIARTSGPGFEAAILEAKLALAIDGAHVNVLGDELRSEGKEWKPTGVREFIEEWWGPSV